MYFVKRRISEKGGSLTEARLPPIKRAPTLVNANIDFGKEAMHTARNASAERGGDVDGTACTKLKGIIRVRIDSGCRR